MARAYIAALAVCLIVASCVPGGVDAKRVSLNDKITLNAEHIGFNADRHNVQARLVEFTFRVDDLFSNSAFTSDVPSDDTLALATSLAEIFADKVVWESQTNATNVRPTPPGTATSQTRTSIKNKYIDMALNSYKNYSNHLTHSVAVTLIGLNSDEQPIYNTKTKYIQHAMMVANTTTGLEARIIHGSFDCDWVINDDGVPQMYRFFSVINRMYQEDHIPQERTVSPSDLAGDI